MPEDRDWVNQALNGDREAFGFLVKKYQGLVYSVAYQMLGNFEDARDLSQEAFLVAYQKLASLEHPDRFGPWLRTIAVNLCRMWHRAARQPRISLDLLIEEGGRAAIVARGSAHVPDPTETAQARELAVRVRAAIAGLPGSYRLVATLAFMSGMPYQAIAEFLDLPVTTVQSRLQRARGMLKERMLTMAQEWFGTHRLPDDFGQKVLAETDAVRVGELAIPELRWGRNAIAVKLTNKGERTCVVGMDVRTEVEGGRRANWQKQFRYDVPARGTRAVRESFNIQRLFRNMGYSPEAACCALRISFACLPAGGPEGQGEYLLERAFFSKTYALHVPPTGATTEAPQPVLPRKNSVSLAGIDVPQPKIGENLFCATLANHTDRPQHIRVHIDVSGGAYGGGETYAIGPHESHDIEQTFHIYPVAERGEPVEMEVQAVVMPENLPQLGWSETIEVWPFYALEYPNSIAYRARTPLNLPPRDA